MKALTVRGIHGREMFQTWRQMYALLESGLDITPIVTHRLLASKYEQGLELMA
jgi:threonine 3-dehydrogenase